MPIYTLRAIFQPTGTFARGNDRISMTHHFQFASDAVAEDACAALVPKFNDSAIARLWVAQRGAQAHILQMFRRSIEYPNRWTLVAEEPFSLAEPIEESLDWTVQGVPVELRGAEAPISNDTRSAVLVIQSNGAGTVTRRSYVGPIAPHGILFRASVPIIGFPFRMWTIGPSLDDPYDPETTIPNLWPDGVADTAIAHVHELDEDLDGSSLIVSWQNGTTYPVQRTRASSVKAYLRSRSARTPLRQGLANIVEA